jgi:hypothetical protein
VTKGDLIVESGDEGVGGKSDGETARRLGAAD